jgi:hypothetical protein
MGMFMKEHDVHVSNFQEQLNQRFAPTIKGHTGGLDEMVKLQKEFGIFRAGRRFEASLLALGVGGSIHAEARRRFHLYLADLRKAKSNVAGKNGDVAIVDALVRNLGAKKPLPVYFQPHDATQHDQVLITDKAQPLFYIAQDYMVVSLPVASAAKGKAKPKATKGAAKKSRGK